MADLRKTSLFAGVPVAALIAGLLSATPFAAVNAHAAACDTREGQRTANIENIHGARRSEISKLRFAPSAKLYTGEASPADIKGIANASATYNVTVTQADDRITFAFKDRAGRDGTLALLKPGGVFVFEIDPRAPRRGREPIRLFKEWRITTPVEGKGIFADGVSETQQLTLIVQGRGNSCTSAADFKSWTLVMQGPTSNYQLFGQLLPPR